MLDRLRYIDPLGLTITVSGSSQDDYLENLEAATGFNLKYNRKGEVKFAGKDPSGKGLSGAQAEVFNAIKGSDNVQINATSGDSGVDFGISTGVGSQTLDFGDINLLGNSKNQSAATPANVVLHETLEAYGTAQGMSIPTAHQYATGLSIGFTTPSATPMISGGMLTGGVLTMGIHGDPGHLLNVTTRLATPVSATGPRPRGRQPQHIVDVSSTP